MVSCFLTSLTERFFDNILCLSVTSRSILCGFNLDQCELHIRPATLNNRSTSAVDAGSNKSIIASFDISGTFEEFRIHHLTGSSSIIPFIPHVSALNIANSMSILSSRNSSVCGSLEYLFSGNKLFLRLGFCSAS